MPPTRRSILKTAIAGISTLTAATWQRSQADGLQWYRRAFTEPEVHEATEYSLGNHKGVETDDIYIDVPHYIKGPGIVPMTVSSILPDVDAIAVLVRENLLPLAAVYHLPPDTDPYINTRIDLFKSSEVIVVARSQGKLYSNSRHVVIGKIPEPSYDELTDPFTDLYDPYDDLDKN